MSATHRIVNGKEIPLTDEEKAAIEAQWAANAPPPPEEQEARERQAQVVAFWQSPEGKAVRAELDELRSALQLPPRIPDDIPPIRR